MSPRLGSLWLALALAGPAHAQSVEPVTAPAPAGLEATAASPTNAAAPWTGREIYERFRSGLAEPGCGEGDSSARWRTHFAHAPRQLAMHDGDVLPLFGYVVESLRAAGLPTEYALIPFVESGYRPGARSAQGPAGLWQMITVTARSHQVSIRPGYDGRLSPVDSTDAAVRYLRKLHGMFGGNWRLAVMAYNAGEYRVLGAIKRSGKTIATAQPGSLPGLSPITQSYVRKLHALSCLMDTAYRSGEWAQMHDKPVPRFRAVSPPESVRDIGDWARAAGLVPDRVERLNPAFAEGRISREGGKPVRLLAYEAASPASDVAPTTAAGAADNASASAPAVARIESAVAQPVAADPATSPAEASGSVAQPAPTGRRHTVVRGDNPSRIAARYAIGVDDLLARNQLDQHSVLHPGRVLLIDAEPVAGTPAAGTR